MRNFITTAAIIVAGLLTMNYWVTAKMALREPLIGCWPIIDPLIGFCF